jgi:hypothetical protein
MARGWESKSVEEQMSIHEEHPASQGAKSKVSSELAKKRTSSPHRRAALQAALSDIEAKLTSFG